ncbi:RNA polymerase subunit sigma-24 [Ruminococcaceae bacterium OttesenSCG-928-A11]|nr:RNA polymerase subunit sigma-24 [Ruminococcaceae bacterium OttesenSCG-928-A11]
MKNYKNSDYAINRHAKGIVYRGQCQTLEITLDDFLAENPHRSKQEFQELKALSDAIYYKQDRDTYNHARLDVSIHGMEDSDRIATPALEDEHIRQIDRRQAVMAAKLLLESGQLTQVQRRRFLLNMIGSLSSNEIAELEGVSQRAVMKSLLAAKSKLKKYFDSMGTNPP